MKEELLAQILEALLAIRGLVVQKTKLIGDCGRLLRELLDSLLQESYENKRHFIRACISGLSRDRNGRSPVVRLLVGKEIYFFYRRNYSEEFVYIGLVSKLEPIFLA
jgi:hypothetical protein